MLHMAFYGNSPEIHNLPKSDITFNFEVGQRAAALGSRVVAKQILVLGKIYVKCYENKNFDSNWPFSFFNF